MDRAAGDRHMRADETRAWSSQLLDRAVDDGIAFRPDRGHQDDVSRGQCRHHLVEGESSTFADTSLPDHRGEGRSDATLEHLGIVAGELREILGAQECPRRERATSVVVPAPPVSPRNVSVVIISSVRASPGRRR